ncbi:hypothetical protein Pint_19278 [Pistacia integerrima]|uniref:Uncharacterized protein n=1 Tax=Pistacia integerrima TaxID=434235 RepID=A0ACC0YYL0_9ROSI|nr:hypothetical protein Pint_19278 [Pistacia integerrima]
MAPTRCLSNLSFLLICMFSLVTSSTAADYTGNEQKAAQNWLNHGGDLYNRRYANKEKNISPKTVSRLNLKWKFYTGGDVTVTPAVFDSTLYFPSWNGYIYAVKADDGALVWKKHLQTLTGFNNTGFILNVNSTVSRAFYVGTSSLEEGLTVELCCNFRGSLAKLDAKTGKILWQTFMLPDNFGKKGEYAGAAIWGSSPSIDPIRNHIYIATGNLYSAPLRTLDVPPGPSPDADFGEAPLMLTMYLNRIKHDLVVAVQKSGFAWALDRNNGSLVWSMEARPGGLGGGGMWGAATDEKRIYTNIANSQHKNFSLRPSKNTTIAGGWVAMDAKNGSVLWSTANPSNATCPWTSYRGQWSCIWWIHICTRTHLCNECQDRKNIVVI